MFEALLQDRVNALGGRFDKCCVGCVCHSMLQRLSDHLDAGLDGANEYHQCRQKRGDDNGYDQPTDIGDQPEVFV